MPPCAILFPARRPRGCDCGGCRGVPNVLCPIIFHITGWCLWCYLQVQCSSLESLELCAKLANSFGIYVISTGRPDWGKSSRMGMLRQHGLCCRSPTPSHRRLNLLSHRKVPFGLSGEASLTLQLFTIYGRQSSESCTSRSSSTFA
jgi:hypothetical protein